MPAIITIDVHSLWSKFCILEFHPSMIQAFRVNTHEGAVPGLAGSQGRDGTDTAQDSSPSGLPSPLPGSPGCVSAKPSDPLCPHAKQRAQQMPSTSHFRGPLSLG